MSTERQRIDWAAVRQQLADAESALNKALDADAGQIDAVYESRARQVAMRRVGTATSERTIKLLVFPLGSETYGLSIADLAEVLPSTQCTRVPRASGEIAGVINLRGELRSVIDLQRLLSVPPVAEETADCILMLRNKPDDVGLKVGRVEKVEVVRESELTSIEAGDGERATGYVQGLSPGGVIVLNADALRLHPAIRTSPQ